MRSSQSSLSADEAGQCRVEDALAAEDDADGDRQSAVRGGLPHLRPERPGVVDTEPVQPQLGLLGEDLVVEVLGMTHGTSGYGSGSASQRR